MTSVLIHTYNVTPEYGSGKELALKPQKYIMQTRLRSEVHNDIHLEFVDVSCNTTDRPIKSRSFNPGTSATTVARP